MTSNPIVRGLLVWAVVSAGTYLLMTRQQRNRSSADALVVGLAAAVAFWTIEWIGTACPTPPSRQLEGFEPEPETKTETEPELVPVIEQSEAGPAAPVHAPASGGADEFARSVHGIFSGDILQIACPDPLQVGQLSYLQRDLFQSELLMGPESQMNLSKLRLVTPDHEPHRLQPLMFRQTLFLMHSAFAHNRNQADLYVKRAKTLVSHQTGPSFREFMLVNPEDPEDRGEVQTDRPVWIVALGGEGLKDAYLRVREDRRIDDVAGEDTSKATRFVLQVRRPMEPGDRHLVVAPGETLFP